MENERDVFKVLNTININEHTKEKGGLTYLSWAWAWQEIKSKYPDTTYEIWRDERGLPFVYDPVLGYMVFTTVTVEGETLPMWLFVMDGANKAMRNEPYQYEVKDWTATKAKQKELQATGKIWNDVKNICIMKTKTCEAATMFDINTTIMRCLTKNISMHGIGLYIYAGEDLPELSDEALNSINKKKIDEINAEIEKLKGCIKTVEIKKYWTKFPEETRKNDAFFHAFSLLCVGFMEKCTTAKHMTDLWKKFPKEIGEDKAFAEKWQEILNGITAQVKPKTITEKPEETNQAPKPITRAAKPITKVEPPKEDATPSVPDDGPEQQEEAFDKLREMTITGNDKAETTEALVEIWNNSPMFHEDNDYYAAYLVKSIEFVNATTDMEILIGLWDAFARSVGNDPDFRVAFKKRRGELSR